MSEPKPISDLLPTTTQEIKNLAPQKQESKELKTGEEKRFAISLQSKLIKDCQIEEVKEVLRYVMVKVGLRAQNFPNDLEKLILFEHIAMFYGGHRIEEIKLAFDMAISGKLDFPEGQSAVCYENFSCLYFSSVMNAYEKWSAEIHRTVIEPKLEKPEQKINTQEELDSYAREAVQVQYSLFIRGFQIINPEVNSAILLKDGLLNPKEKVIEFYQRMAEKKVLAIYKPS